VLVHGKTNDGMRVFFELVSVIIFSPEEHGIQENMVTGCSEL
jgi:hypothetical protein